MLGLLMLSVMACSNTSPPPEPEPEPEQPRRAGRIGNATGKTAQLGTEPWSGDDRVRTPPTETPRDRAARAAEREIWGPRGRPWGVGDPRLHLPRHLRPPAGVDRVDWCELLRMGLDREEALEMLRLREMGPRQLREFLEKVGAGDESIPAGRRAVVMRLAAKQPATAPTPG